MDSSAACERLLQGLVAGSVRLLCWGLTAQARPLAAQRLTIPMPDKGDVVVILLAGGDKNSQDKDIRLAKDLARNL